jgi:polar amino acid transport system permease protein
MALVYLASVCPEVVRGFDAGCFRNILFSSVWFEPALLVLLITVVSQTAGVILGLPLALGRLSKNQLIRRPVDFYLWIFRGTPLLLQILFVYDGLAQITDNAKFLDPITHSTVTAGIVVLALNEAAYMAEILRSGLQAVDPGQIDAAKALGMTQWTVMRRIVLPQAMRVVVPPTTNEYINMSKNTSLLVIISVHELLQQASAFYSTNFRYFEALAVAAIYYLAITTLLTQIQAAIERRFGERQDPPLAPGFMRRAMTGAGSLPNPAPAP